mgnify:CR=1 FL=1
MKFTIPSITFTLPTINFKQKLHTATSPDQPRTTLKQKLHAYTAPKPSAARETWAREHLDGDYPH